MIESLVENSNWLISSFPLALIGYMIGTSGARMTSETGDNGEKGIVVGAALGVLLWATNSFLAR